MKYFMRLLALPFVFGLVIICTIYNLIKYLVLWVRFGGELVLIKQNMDKTGIQEIFDELIKQNKK